MKVPIKQVHDDLYVVYDSREYKSAQMTRAELLSADDMNGVADGEITVYGTFDAYKEHLATISSLFDGDNPMYVVEEHTGIVVLQNLDADTVMDAMSADGVFRLSDFTDHLGREFALPLKAMQNIRVLDCYGLPSMQFQGYRVDDERVAGLEYYKSLEDLYLPDWGFLIDQYEFAKTNIVHVYSRKNPHETEEDYYSCVIQPSAFVYCNELQYVDLSTKELVLLPDNVFMCCSKLHTVLLPDSIGSIGRNVFYGCENLKSLQLPLKLKSVGENAFGSTGLVSLCFPKSVTDIPWSSFVNCGSLQEVIFMGHMNTSEDINIADSEKSNLRVIRFKGSASTIMLDTFLEFPKLELVELPENRKCKIAVGFRFGLPDNVMPPLLVKENSGAHLQLLRILELFPNAQLDIRFKDE